MWHVRRTHAVSKNPPKDFIFSKRKIDIYRDK